MRYSQLRAFYHVARQGGFSRAAAHLNQSQPSLSDHVRQLERDHDVLLFTRRNRKVVLTEAGEDLFRLARQFFDAEEVIGEFLDQSRKALQGRVRIMADSSAHITTTLHRFRQAHPGILVELKTGNSAEVLNALRQYEADIGIFGSTTASPDLDTLALGVSPIIALAAPGFFDQHDARPGHQRAMATGLSFDDLVDLPLIFRERGSETQAQVIEAARLAGVRLKPAMVVEGREAMRDLVAAGFGIGFAAAAEIVADSRLDQISINAEGLDMAETVACLTARRDVPVIRAFFNMLAETDPGASLAGAKQAAGAKRG